MIESEIGEVLMYSLSFYYLLFDPQGAYSVIYYHNNSVAQALCDLFPEMGFSKDKFYKKCMSEPVAICFFLSNLLYFFFC